MSESSSWGSMGDLRLTPPRRYLSPPRLLRDLRSLSADSNSTISIPMRTITDFSWTEPTVISLTADRPKRTGPRNTYRCCNKGKTDSSLTEMLESKPRAQHDKIAKQWDRNNKWTKTVELNVLNSKFDAECEQAFNDNSKIELTEQKSNDVWKLTNPNKFGTKPFKGMGVGVFTSKPLKGEVKVLTETGITGKPDGLRLPATLLASRVKLSHHGNPPDSYSPFPDYTLKQWNQARLTVASNAFTVNKNRVLFKFVSRLNHSCNPNLVRKHTGKKIELITTRKIKSGEQLTIQYSAESGHEDTSHFKCSCKKTLAQRQAISQNGREIVDDYVRE